MSEPTSYYSGSYVVVTPGGRLHQPDRIFQEPGGAFWLGQPHDTRYKPLCDLYWRDAAEHRLAQGFVEIGIYLLPRPGGPETFRSIRLQYKSAKWLPVDLTIAPEGTEAAMEWLQLDDVTIISCEDQPIGAIPPALASVMMSRMQPRAEQQQQQQQQQQQLAPEPTPPKDVPPPPGAGSAKGLVRDANPDDAARPDAGEPEDDK